MTHLSISGVSKAFGETVVLRDINLDVERGTFVTLLGPSGCGKTTLLRIVAGLENPDTGVVLSHEKTFVDAQKNFFMSPQHRNLGFVFQDYGLWPHMTVADNVAFPLTMAKWSKADIDVRIKEVLANVQLSTQADKLPEQLSGGQKQRVSIARALAAKPDLILFDEPLSNLDANLREELGQEIRLLSKQLGLTCINVTHDRREAQILSDQIALMKDGVFHQYGKPEELFGHPRDRWAAEFLDAGNILPVREVFTDQRKDQDADALVPRGAITISESESPIKGRVLNTIYLDDRFEVIVEIAGQAVKLFSTQTVQMNDIVPLHIDESLVTVLAA